MTAPSSEQVKCHVCRSTLLLRAVEYGLPCPYCDTRSDAILEVLRLLAERASAREATT